MSLLDTYLSRHDLTRYRLAKVSGISETTWSNVKKKDFDQFTGKQLLAIANAIGKTVGQVADELVQLELENKKK